MDSVTIYHLKELASKQRTWIKCNEVKLLNVPHFKGLKFELILEYAKQYPEVMAALPSIEREIIKLPREYLCNVIHTLIGDPFYFWV